MCGCSPGTTMDGHVLFRYHDGTGIMLFRWPSPPSKIRSVQETAIAWNKIKVPIMMKKSMDSQHEQRVDAIPDFTMSTRSSVVMSRDRWRSCAKPSRGWILTYMSGSCLVLQSFDFSPFSLLLSPLSSVSLLLIRLVIFFSLLSCSARSLVFHA